MKSVLITGASGLIGSRCGPLLAARGFEVLAPTLSDLDLFDERQRRDYLARTRPTHLLHLAWYTEHGKFWASPKNLGWVAASLSLVEEFVASGGRRVVGAGTCAEYAWSDALLKERASELKPTTLYGTAKKSLHELLERAAAPLGFSCAWGRVFFLYGPGEARGRFVPSVILPLLAGEPALLSDGRQVRDLLHADDVAGGLVALLDSAVEGPVNIASGIGTPLAHVAEQIGKLLGRPDLIRLGARERNADDPPAIVADAGRLRDETGWRPARTLDGGLDGAIAWWRAEARREAHL